MSCLATNDETLSSLSLSGSGAEKMKRFRESKCLKVKRRRGRVFDLVRNESVKSLLRMIENQSFDTYLESDDGIPRKSSEYLDGEIKRNVCCGVFGVN
ncbi:unnamed protein product [Arabidopsis lyrata]|nr:unnamed protein product [Arabidopsis lyrata]